MSEEPNDSPEAPSRRGGRVLKSFFLGILVLAAVGGGVFFFLAWMSQKAFDNAKEEVVEFIRIFQPDVVIESFEEWREMKATGNDGNILEIATAEATEKFSRKTAVAMFGTNLPLGTTVSEITIPATYRYHIDLNGNWFLTSDGNRLLVLAPRVQPSLPVAFDTAKVEKKTKSGWARWDGSENLEALEKSVTSKLAIRAAQEEAIQKARDAGREGVAEFVKTWLLSEDAWGDQQFEEIVVRFEGENEKSLSSMPSTLKVEPKSEVTIEEGQIGP